MKKIFAVSLLPINLLAVCWMWWLNSGALWSSGLSGSMIAAGRLAGLLLQLQLLVQLVLIGRISWIEGLFGHDRLNRAHRAGGFAAALLLLAHPALLVVGYGSGNGVSPAAQLQSFISNWEDVAKAAIALLLLLALIGLSVAIVRRRLRYETWYFAHLTAYLALALAFGHQINGATVSQGAPLYYWLALNMAVFGSVLAWRWLRPLWLYFRHRFRISRVTRETPDIISVYVSGRDLQQYKFKAGQFANLTFLQRGMWFTHPFSFSQAPGNPELRFTMKAAGDFTSQAFRLRPGTTVVIDGPLGRFTETSGKGKFLLLAAGVGITPLRALAEQLERHHKDTLMLYGVKTAADLAFAAELEKLKVAVVYFLSQQTDLPPGPYRSGIITLRSIAATAPDFLQREIYICGPDGFIAALASELAAAGAKPEQIHYERFAY